MLSVSGVEEGGGAGEEGEVGASLWVKFKASEGNWVCSETPMLSVVAAALSCASASAD